MDERTQAVLGPSWRTEQGRGAAGGVAAAGSLRCPHEGEGPPAVLRRQLHCHRREGTEMHCQPEGGGCPRPPAMASCAANWGWGVLPGEGGSWSCPEREGAGHTLLWRGCCLLLPSGPHHPLFLSINFTGEVVCLPHMQCIHPSLFWGFPLSMRIKMVPFYRV